MSAEQPPELAVEYHLVPPSPEEGVPIFYANFFQATVSPHDMTLHLGWYAVPALTQAPTEPVSVQVRGLAKVSVPLNLVPGIVNVLQTQLENWRTSIAAQADSQEGQEAITNE